MADLPILKAVGLYTSANEFSGAPEGALAKADNVVIRSKNIIEPRRGQSLSSYTFGSSNSQAKALFVYGGSTFVHYENGGGTIDNTADTLARDTGASFVTVGSYNAPEPSLLRMKGAEAEENFYFTTDAGIVVMESTSSTPRAAGVPKAREPYQFGNYVGTGAWLATDSIVAYRAVWVEKDPHGRLRIGEPSGWVTWVNSSGGTRYVGLRIPLVTGTTSASIVRLYRSEAATPATGTPSEEMYLAVEAAGRDTLTLAVGSMSRSGSSTVTVTHTNHGYQVSDNVQITATGETLFAAGEYTVTAVTSNTFTYTDASSAGTGTNTNAQTATPRSMLVYDRMPEILLSDPLYTNPSQPGGILAANAPPPLARDLTVWNNRMWYANTTALHRFSLQLLGVSAPDGLQDGDTLTIAGRTYTARTTPSTSTEFQIYSSATSALSIRDTCYDLLRVIYADTSQTVDAFYVSGIEDSPGKLLIQARTLGGAAFTVYASRATAWSPVLTTSSTDAEESDNDRAPNRLYYSKPNQPESVPLLNYLDVGVKNEAIYRVHPLRERLYVFKPDGIFVVSGEFPYRVDLLDDTTKIIAADSVASVNNSIYALTNQGVVSVSDAGVRIVSSAIERDLISHVAFYERDVKTFGVSYESDRQYMLWLGNDPGDEYCGEAFVYHVLTGAWTRWPVGRTCGIVKTTTTTSTLILGGGSSSSSHYQKLWTERKLYGYNAYVDDEIDSTTISSISADGLTLTLSASTAATEGDLVLGATNGGWGIVSSTTSGGSGNTVTMKVKTGTFTASETVYFRRAIECNVKWLAQAPGGPNTIKQFSEATFHFRQHDFYEADAKFRGDVVTSELTVPIEFAGRSLTRSNTYATRIIPQGKRVLVPARQQIATCLEPGFYIREAYAMWSLNGLTLHFNHQSERNSR